MLQGFKAIAINTLSDRWGNISSKRIFTAFACLLIAIAFGIDTFSHYHVTEFIYNGLVYLALGGLGSTAAESFGTPGIGMFPHSLINSGGGLPLINNGGYDPDLERNRN